jgi:hypothetical protein
MATFQYLGGFQAPQQLQSAPVSNAPALQGMAIMSNAIDKRMEHDEKTAKLETFNRLKEEGLKLFQSGTPDEVAEWVMKNPEVGKAMDLSQSYINKNKRTKESANTAFYSFLSDPTPENAMKAGAAHKGVLTAEGQTDQQATDEFIQLAQTNPEEAKKYAEFHLAAPRYLKYKKAIAEAKGEGEDTKLQKVGSLLVKSPDGDLSIVTGSWNPKTGKMDTSLGTIPKGYVVLSKMGETADEQQTREIKTTEGKESVKQAVRLETEPQIAGAKASAELRSKLFYDPKITAANLNEKEFSETITTGTSAADNVAQVDRALDLLQQVKTGGWNNVSYKTRQAFGLENANEAELNQLMGKAVISQLKPIFGAQFTVAEGQELKKLEQSFGRNTDSNIRLLRNLKKGYEKSALRARAAAENRGNKEKVNEIDALLKYSKQNAKQPTKPIESTPTVSTKAQYDALPSGAVYIEDGKKYRKP